MNNRTSFCCIQKRSGFLVKSTSDTQPGKFLRKRRATLSPTALGTERKLSSSPWAKRTFSNHSDLKLLEVEELKRWKWLGESTEKSPKKPGNCDRPVSCFNVYSLQRGNAATVLNTFPLNSGLEVFFVLNWKLFSSRSQ